MNLYRHPCIGNYKSVAVRDMLARLYERDGDPLEWSAITGCLRGFPEEDLKRIFTGLVDLGYASGDGSFYALTLQGNQMRCARAVKPLARKAADSLLIGLLSRVAEVNSDVHKFAYRVQRISLFGSYLSDRDPISDIDILYDLEQVKDDTQFAARCTSSVTQANKQWMLYDCREYLFAHSQVIRFLRNRSPHLHMMSRREVVLPPNTTMKTVYRSPQL